MLVFVIEDQPHRTGTDLRRKLVACLLVHGSTFSGVGASGKPGAVHTERKRSGKQSSALRKRTISCCFPPPALSARFWRLSASPGPWTIYGKTGYAFVSTRKRWNGRPSSCSCLTRWACLRFFLEVENLLDCFATPRRPFAARSHRPSTCRASARQAANLTPPPYS